MDKFVDGAWKLYGGGIVVVELGGTVAAVLEQDLKIPG